MNMHRWIAPWGMATALWAAAASAQNTAPVAVDGAWARASVPGQKATGAFMRLTARDATRLVRVESPAAGVAEVHEMKLEGGVMKMRAVPGVDLPAGQAVELKPGGYHVMLMDLKAPLSKGGTVPITLVFRDAKGAESQLPLQVPVAAQAPGAAAAPAMDHSGHKH